MLLMLVVFVGLIFLAAFFLKGGLWLSSKLAPLFSKISILLLALFIVVLLPLALIKKIRGISGGAMISFSYIFGLTLWMWSFLITFALWGTLALIIGFFLMGIGFIPMALLATALKGMWSTFGQLFILLAMFFGSASLGSYFLQKHEDKEGY